MSLIVHLVPEWPTKYQTFVQDDIEISQTVCDSVTVFAFSTTEAGLRRILFWVRRLGSLLFGFMRFCNFQVLSSRISERKLPIKLRIRFYILIGKMPWLLTEKALVHAHFLAHTAELGAYLGMLNNRIILVATAHGSEVLMNTSSKLIDVASKYDYIIGASKAVLEDLNRKAVSLDSSITSSQYVRYCRTYELTSSSDENPAVHASFTKTWRFLSIGRMHPQKGWEICISLALELKRKSINFKWIFIGDGDQFQKIQSLVHIHNLQNEISLLGWKPRNFCLEMMKESEFTVLPSIVIDNHCDGLPLVILESMRTCSIVISTRVAGIPEAIGENRGILLDELVENSASRIISLMNDAEGRKNIIKSAQLWVAQNTSFDNSDPLLEVYGNAFRKLA